MDFHEAAGNTFAFDSDSEHDVTTVYWTQAPKWYILLNIVT